MKKIVFLVLVLACLRPDCSGQRTGFMDTFRGRVLFTEAADGDYEVRKIFTFLHKEDHENPRLVAIVLNVSLGLLGVHRLYLGTDLLIPVVYTLTCGGGCILWIADLGMLIFTKDIEKYYDNPHLFMWIPNG